MILEIIGDAFVEPVETVTVGLVNPENATIGSPPVATVTIGDDDFLV